MTSGMKNAVFKPDRYKRQEKRLLMIAAAIAVEASKKDYEYKSSWRKRGGVGAYFTFVRKWDRIEAAVETDTFLGQPVNPYDVFQRFALDTRKEGIKEDVSDVVGYMLVLLEHMVEEGLVTKVFDLSFDGGYDYEAKEPDPVVPPRPDACPTSPGLERSGRTEQPRPFGFDPEQDVSPPPGLPRSPEVSPHREIDAPSGSGSLYDERC